MDFEKGEYMLDELLKEIEVLRSYKNLYECALSDKQTMSDMLYEYMTKEYENTLYEDRCKSYIENNCSCCRHRLYGCDYQNNLPEDILQPVPSDRAWIPPRKNCGHFEWS